MPEKLGSFILVKRVYFVAITKWSLSEAINSPTYFSLVPSVYLLAVSIKFPPEFAYKSKICLLSSLVEPQPHSSPKVIVPRASSKTLNPHLPNNLYFILIHD